MDYEYLEEMFRLLCKIPHLVVSGPLPPLRVVNGILEKGELDLGMSGYVKWKPTQIPDEVYEELVILLIKRNKNVYKCDAPSYVQDYSDFQRWRLLCSVDDSDGMVSKLLAEQRSLELLIKGFSEKKDTEAIGKTYVDLIRVSSSLSEAIRNRRVGTREFNSDEMNRSGWVDVDLIRSNEELIKYMSNGEPVNFHFFYGHRNVSGKSVTGAHCLSQWCRAPFEVNGVKYNTAEQFMMSEKAKLFGDKVTLGKILSAKTPGEAKKLGREILGFDEDIWCEHRFDIVVQGNMAKFSQNEAMAKYLIETGYKVLVEASPKDKIWGIGLSEDNLDAKNPSSWKGLNLLGYALMEVRRNLRDE